MGSQAAILMALCKHLKRQPDAVERVLHLVRDPADEMSDGADPILAANLRGQPIVIERNTPGWTGSQRKYPPFM
jgi:hypothetical protein